MAMENGEDLRIVPPVSMKLFHNIHYSLIPIIGKMFSLPQSVKVYASETTSDRYPKNNGVVTGFSAGIDSFTLLRDHYFENLIPEYKITYLLFNDVGSHGVQVQDKYSSGKKLSRKYTLTA
jgi:hypothetical protein